METKMITIPFDVELAKKIQAGEHPGLIVTRGGKDVRVVCFDAKRGLSIVCLVMGNDGNEYVQTYKSDGNYYGDGEESRHDLVLQVPEWTQYKDGDILACEVHNGPNDYCKWFAVLDGNIGFMLGYASFSSYVSYDYDSSYKAEQLIYRESHNGVDSIRLITEEEKQMFIDRLKKENTDQTKEYLKRYFGIGEAEEKPMCEFEPFQKVLVRFGENEMWKCDLYSHYEDGYNYPFACVGGGYGHCVSYNEKTKHLVGTTDDWEGE